MNNTYYRHTCGTSSKVVIAALLAAVTLPVLASRNQLWTKGEIEGSLFQEGWAQNIRVKVEQELKWNLGDEGHARFYDTETLMMLGYKWCPYISTYGGWRYVNEQSSSLHGDLKNESRPTIDIVLTAPEFWTLKFDSRTRIEFRNKRSTQAYVRYRERLRLRTSWSVTDFKISPYCSEEAFFEAKNHVAPDEVYDRNRAQVGLSFKPMPEMLPGLGCNLYYMVQHDWFDHSHWTPTNIYGVEFEYKI